MPRVASGPRVGRTQTASTHHSSPLKIPLNDDRQEKAVRLQSRQALHDLQLNQIRAAASPVRKVSNHEANASSSPITPQTSRTKSVDAEDEGLLTVVQGASMTPMKRVPILANFEEWMKMATDNKINATNSWNFALIDYFHDMSLLKEGDGVNFQKASCTLDGCVKIYTSRVDSVATETGKLLSGLAESGSKKQKQSEDHGSEEDEGEMEDEDGSRKRSKKKMTRSSEATLVQSYHALQLKKLELEFTVDPLFKKTSADFDEGGAKGLLLNHLAIDAQGRIVFDSSDDPDDDPGSALEADSSQETDEVEIANRNAKVQDLKESQIDRDASASKVDLGVLRLKFFPDLEILNSQDLCPSLKNFDLGDPKTSLDIPYLKDSDSGGQDLAGQEAQSLGGASVFEDAPYGIEEPVEEFGALKNAAFGVGGEVWAKEAILESQSGVHEDDPEGDEIESAAVQGFKGRDDRFGLSLTHGRQGTEQENILSYFDNSLRKNWAGPEHWKIRRIKDSDRQAVNVPRRREKELFKIDFSSPLDPTLSELIYTSASSQSSISISKAQQKSRTRNLLPDDKHFNSRELLGLFMKPKARLGFRGHASRRTHQLSGNPRPEQTVDEAFWATQGLSREQSDGEDAQQADYDANFFQDDPIFPSGLPDDDEDEFTDAREAFSPANEGQGEALNGFDQAGKATVDGQSTAFGAQLVTQSNRVRPEYVQYARVAKKVDVRKLKEEMWKGMDIQEVQPPSQNDSRTNDKLKFTSVINGLQTAYPKQAMQDISTSFCFICLLHLANEKGLQIDNENGLEELSIRRDLTAMSIPAT